MALWRDLIPRLHRADDFDSRLHLLDDYDNATTFEASGTRRLPPSDDWSRYPPPTPSTVDPAKPASSGGTSAALNEGGSRTSTPARTVVTESSRTSTPEDDSGGELAASQEESGDDDDVGDHSTLLKTAAVGCALLALNVVVFTAVMCQWRGLRRTRLRDLQKYAAEMGGGAAGGVVLGVPFPSGGTTGDAGVTGDRLVATYTAASPPGRCESSPPSPSVAATVLTPAECICNNVVGIDGGIAMTAPSNYYTTHLPTTNHIADYHNQRTTSTV